MCAPTPSLHGARITHKALRMLACAIPVGLQPQPPAQPLVEKKVLHSFMVQSLVQLLTLEVSNTVRVGPTEPG